LPDLPKIVRKSSGRSEAPERDREARGRLKNGAIEGLAKPQYACQ
jgi:hypothetical protein